MLLRKSARLQHYTFAHVDLPTAVFESTEETLIPLLAPTGRSDSGREHLLAFWERARSAAPFAAPIPSDQLDYTTEVLGHPDSTVFCITLPEPRFRPEAAFIAIVFDGPGLAAGSPRQLRYFVLEFHGMKEGQRTNFVAEWSPIGKGKLDYVAHGKEPTLDAVGFLNVVRKIVESSGTQPVPVGLSIRSQH